MKEYREKIKKLKCPFLLLEDPRLLFPLQVHQTPYQPKYQLYQTGHVPLLYCMARLEMFCAVYSSHLHSYALDILLDIFIAKN